MKTAKKPINPKKETLSHLDSEKKSLEENIKLLKKEEKEMIKINATLEPTTEEVRKLLEEKKNAEEYLGNLQTDVKWYNNEIASLRKVKDKIFLEI